VRIIFSVGRRFIRKRCGSVRMDATSFDTCVGAKAQPREDRPRYRLGNAFWVVLDGSAPVRLLGAFARLLCAIGSLNT